jgi:hypothetical protein
MTLHLDNKSLSKNYPAAEAQKEQNITLHLGQNLSNNYPVSGAKKEKNNPASGAKHDQKLSCIWGKI